MSLVPVLQHPAVEALGWSLLHFVWQGLAVAALLAVVLIPLRRASAHVRHLVECGALALMAACPVLTWCWLSATTAAQVIPVPSPAPVAIVEPSQMRAASATALRAIELPGDNRGSQTGSEIGREFELGELPPSAAQLISPVPTPKLTERVRATIESSLPWLVCGWLLGVAVLSSRLLLGWRVIQRIKRLATSPAAEVWHTRCKHLAIRLGIRQSVKLVESALIEVPTVIGWIRPLILIPASALNGLEPSQLEAILAHELAHIQRHDYIVNLIQTALETLLFYHPAVWWVSRLIRNEREHCCDDIAVEMCGNRVIYARALAEMESLRGSPRLTLAATDGSLLGRIKRLVCPASEARNSVWWAASPMAIVIVVGMMLGAYVSIPANADAEAESVGLVAEVPGGIKVELLGVSASEGEPRWWNANGQPLDKNPLPSIVHGKSSTPLNDYYRFAVRITGLKADEDSWIVVDNVPGISTAGSVDPDLREQISEAGPISSAQTARLRVALRRGEFGPAQVVTPECRKLPVNNLPADLKPWYDKITPLMIHEADGQSRIYLPAFDLRRQRAFIRWTAIDIDGKEVPHLNYQHINGCEVISFDLPLSRVARFEYRLQPYKHWVTFAKVSLQSGHKTQPAVKIGEKITEPKVHSAELRGALQTAIARGNANRQATKTAHIKFRSFDSVILRTKSPGLPGTRFGLSPSQCAQLLQRYDLLKHPDNLQKLVAELQLVNLDGTAAQATETELYVDGTRFRESRLRKVGKSDVHITDGTLSVAWDAAKSQAEISPMAMGFRPRTTLDDFRQALFAVDDSQTDIKRENGQIVITYSNNDHLTGEFFVNEATGFQTKRILRGFDFQDRPSGSSSEAYWQGWQQGPDGTPFPRIVVDFQFNNGMLSVAAFKVVDEATFNTPLPETLFKLNAPAGSIIVDHRQVPVSSRVTINRDVSDVTSAEQVRDATRPALKDATSNAKSEPRTVVLAEDSIKSFPVTEASFNPLKVPEPIKPGGSVRLDPTGEPLLPGQVQRFGSTRFRVPGWWRTVAFSEDGEWIWCKADDSVSVVHRKTGYVVDHSLLRLEAGNVQSMAMSPSGKLVAIGIIEPSNGKDQTTYHAVVLDTKTTEHKQVVRWMGPPSGLHCLAISPDDRMLLAGTQLGEVRVCEIGSGQVLCEETIEGASLWDGAFSTDGQTIVLVGSQESYSWRYAEAADKIAPRKLEPRVPRQLTVCFSPDGKWFATGSSVEQDGFRLWDANSGSLKVQFKAGGARAHPDGGMAFTPDSRVLAAPVSDADLVELWDVNSYQRLATLPVPHPRSVAISRDGQWLAATGGSSRIAIFDLASRTLVNPDSTGHDEPIRQIRFILGGTMVSSASDGSLRLWNVTTGQSQIPHPILPDSRKWVQDMAVSPDGASLLTNAMDNTLGIWNLNSGERLATLPGHGRLGGARAVAYTPDGSQFVSWGDDMELRRWDSKTRVLLKKLLLALPGYIDPEKGGHMFRRLEGVLTPDAKSIFVLLDDRLHEFDTNDGRLLRSEQFPRCSKLTISADGLWLATAEIGSQTDENPPQAIVLRDRTALKIAARWTLPEPIPNADEKVNSSIRAYVSAIKFSPDSQRLAWSYHGAMTGVDVAEIASQKVKSQIQCTSTCWSLEFSPDSQKLATGHYDTTVALWDLAQFPLVPDEGKKNTRDAPKPPTP